MSTKKTTKVAAKAAKKSTTTKAVAKKPAAKAAPSKKPEAKKADTRKCAKCGKTFEAKSANARYCSESCYKAAKDIRKKTNNHTKAKHAKAEKTPSRASQCVPDTKKVVVAKTNIKRVYEFARIAAEITMVFNFMKQCAEVLRDLAAKMDEVRVGKRD